MSQDCAPTASLSPCASSTLPPHRKNVSPHVKLEVPMFQLLSVICLPIITELHKESSFMFSLVSHSLKRMGKISLKPSLPEPEQCCSVSFPPLRRVRTTLKSFWKSFNQTVLIHISCFKELQALFLRNHLPKTLTSEVLPNDIYQRNKFLTSQYLNFSRY